MNRNTNQFNQTEKMLLSVSDAQRLLSVSRTTMYALLNRDDFPKLRLKAGGKIYIPKKQLLQWFDKQLSQTTEGQVEAVHPSPSKPTQREGTVQNG